MQADGQEPDAKLTELGIQQAVNLTEFLLDKDIDFIISSPFERAYRTIAPLAQ
ncbi:putative histidine phosphatase family protein [Paenibacillus agaridevorans]|uniref:Putative histidine phosphatase family protein n=1 Tax=Paenibacillus agaridevorans TaxID=171404 RepID=A0A2R5EG92_9BACL|nr:putative histidine phosphatase family protein [Paenibacillus agaridevorans]